MARYDDSGHSLAGMVLITVALGTLRPNAAYRKSFRTKYLQYLQYLLEAL